MVYWTIWKLNVILRVHTYIRVTPIVTDITYSYRDYKSYVRSANVYIPKSTVAVTGIKRTLA